MIQHDFVSTELLLRQMVVKAQREREREKRSVMILEVEVEVEYDVIEN